MIINVLPMASKRDNICPNLGLETAVVKRQQQWLGTGSKCCVKVGFGHQHFSQIFGNIPIRTQYANTTATDGGWRNTRGFNQEFDNLRCFTEWQPARSTKQENIWRLRVYFSKTNTMEREQMDSIKTIIRIGN